jgi:hypothetical protein
VPNNVVPNHVYTPEEANQILPEVRRAVEQVATATAELPDLQEAVALAELMNQKAGDIEESRESLARAVAALRSTELGIGVALRRLEELDVVLKDPFTGLVDFYAYRDGEMIELCWRLGEPAVANWHPIGEGFPGRRPL